MGRRDAVQVTLEVVARMRQILPSLVVSYEPGWETRGNGTSANYEGGLVHHTASASSLARPFPTQTVLRQGRSDLPGPLCNFAGPACTTDAPRLHVMAANPANHAGASGGRSMGPLPRTSLFNPRVLGLEIDYAGTVPMLAGQLLVAHVWSRAVADVVGGGDIERVRAHFETSVTGKWDIGAGAGSVDMGAFRRDAATITAPLEDDMVQFTEEHARRLDAIYDGLYRGGPSTPGTRPLVDLIGETHGRVNDVYRPGDPNASPTGMVSLRQEIADAKTAAATVAGRPVADVRVDIDEAAIIAGVQGSLAEAVRLALAARTDDEVAAIARAAADEQDRRQRERLAQPAG